MLRSFYAGFVHCYLVWPYIPSTNEKTGYTDLGRTLFRTCDVAFSKVAWVVVNCFLTLAMEMKERSNKESCGQST